MHKEAGVTYKDDIKTPGYRERDGRSGGWVVRQGKKVLLWFHCWPTNRYPKRGSVTIN